MMKEYVKPRLEYFELRPEEGIACTASTPIFVPVPVNSGGHGHGHGHSYGNGRH